MEDKQVFECENCGKKDEMHADKSTAPECCGQQMKEVKLDACTTSTTAEHSRLDDFNDACDDGRAGS